MSEQQEKPQKQSKRIKNITVRFNREILPFQHVRIEAMSTITKDNDVDEVTEELLAHLEHLCDEVERRIYKAAYAKKTDDLPY